MKLRLGAVVCLALWILIVSPKSFFSVQNQRIYDAQGGERIFHGVNFVYKNQSVEEDFVKLKSQGINGIRISLVWSDFEPQQGKYNEGYLQKFVDLVNLAGKYNIFSLVEFHQDLFSPKFCGDGVPVWAIGKQVYESFPLPIQKHHTQFDEKTGLPVAGFCQNVKQWGSLYATKAVNKAFSHLWRNKNGLLDNFALYWKKVAAAFKGNPYVIAFELINEPWPGDMFKNPTVMIPGLSQSINLQRAYDQLSTQIRKVDPDINICFEPVTWLNNFQSGFKTAPGGRRFSNSSIFCYHFYNPPTLDLDGFMKARTRDMKRLNVGGILSQFFILNGYSKSSLQMMDKCDELSQSWFGWVYQRQQNSLIKQIKRTYSHRVAGTILSQKYNPITKQYTLYYKSKKNTGDTIIYFDSKVDYSEGFNVNIYPKLDKPQFRVVDSVYLYVDSGQFADGALVMVVLTT